MKRIEYDMYRSLAVWGRRVIKTENAVSRMKLVVKGRHWYSFKQYYRHWVGLKETYPLPF